MSVRVHTVDVWAKGFDFGRVRGAVLESVKTGEAHVWWVNAPLGLAGQTFGACGVEEEWLAGAEWMASFGSAREWRRAVRRMTRKEPRRRSEVCGKGGLAPMNLRMFKRTWGAVVELCLPLVREESGGVSIAPVWGEHGARVVVAEAREGGAKKGRWVGAVPKEAQLESWAY